MAKEIDGLEFNDEIEQNQNDQAIIEMIGVLQSLVNADLSDEATDAALSWYERRIDSKSAVRERLLYDLANLREAQALETAKKILSAAMTDVKEYRETDRVYAPIKEESLPDFADIKPRAWLIDQFLIAHELTLFNGQGGVGKSRLMLQIVAKLACGWEGTAWQSKDRQSHFSHNQDKKRVYIASWEDDGHEHARRLRTAIKRLGWIDYRPCQEKIKFVDLRADGRGPLWGVPPGQNLNTRAGLLPFGEVFLNQAKAFGPNLLVLDPLSAVFGGNENDRASVREFTSFFSRWANENKCAVLILAHPPKSGASYSGNTDWEGSPRGMWFLYREETKEDSQNESDRYKLEVTKLSYAAKPTPFSLELDQGVWIEQDLITRGGKTNGEFTSSF